MDSNFYYLSERLKEAGFGEDLLSPLENHLQRGYSSFILHYAVATNPGVTVALAFWKWRNLPFYYFKKFHVEVRQKQGGTARSRDFYFGRRRDPRVTLPEAIELLKGRPVIRNDPHYPVKLRLDFNSTDASGNYTFKYIKIKVRL